MKKKKFKLLLPISNCCLKKFIDLETISKYGSIVVISLIILSQIFNIIIGSNYIMSFLSMIINTFIPMIISIFGSKVGDFATEKALMYLSTRTGGGFLLCIGLQCLNYYLLSMHTLLFLLVHW